MCVFSPQTVPLCLNSLPSSSKRDARDIIVFNASLLDRHFVPVPPGADSLTPSRLILYHTLVPRTQNQKDLRTWPSEDIPTCSGDISTVSYMYCVFGKGAGHPQFSLTLRKTSISWCFTDPNHKNGYIFENPVSSSIAVLGLNVLSVTGWRQ